MRAPAGVKYLSGTTVDETVDPESTGREVAFC